MHLIIYCGHVDDRLRRLRPSQAFASAPAAQSVRSQRAVARAAAPRASARVAIAPRSVPAKLRQSCSRSSRAAARTQVVAAAEAPKTIVDAAVADPQFSILVEAVVKVRARPSELLA